MKLFAQFLCHTCSKKTGYMIGLSLLLLMLVSCGGGATNTPPTPVPSVSFSAFDLKLPPKALQAPVKGPLPDNTSMHVAVTFKVNQAVLDKIKTSKQKVNLETMANQLGISDQTYQKIKDLFGVTDAQLKLDGLHTYLTIDAKAKTFAQVFQTSFLLHTLNGRTFYAPTSNPKIPSSIAPQVLAISGLDSISSPPHPLLRRQSQQGRVHAQGQEARSGCSQAAGEAMQAIAHIYGYDQLWQKGWQGQGMTVNLLEFGPITQADYQTFAQCTHSQTKIEAVNIDGGLDPNDPSYADSAGEATLDAEMVQALAPQATIVDYQSSIGQTDLSFWGHFNDELRQIIKDNDQNPSPGSVVSISYGGSEVTMTDNDRAALDQSLQLLTQAEQMTVFAASGDCAAFDTGQYNMPSVDYPAASPWVVAVGGTMLEVGNKFNRLNEVVWSDGSDRTKCNHQWGSGGGNSVVYPRPDWQQADGVNNKYSDGHRQIPDISAIAFNVPIFFNGQWIPVRGTSAAAPIWTSGFILTYQGLIAQGSQIQTYFAGPQTFYAVASYQQAQHPYFDVIQGDNLYYPAGPGWDYATGLGTPDLMNFYNVLLALSERA